VLVLKGVASAEEESHAHVHSARQSLRVPSVIRLLEYRRIPHQTRALSRKNILMRDRYTCQYCHRVMPSGELTLDHVFRGRALAKPLGRIWWPAVTLAIIARKPYAGRSGHEVGQSAASVQPAHQPASDAATGEERCSVAEVFVY